MNEELSHEEALAGAREAGKRAYQEVCAKTRVRPPAMENTQSIAELRARMDYENGLVEAAAGKTAESFYQIAAAVDRICGQLMDWVPEEEAVAISGRNRGYIRDRFSHWQAAGIARVAGKQRFLLRSAVLAIVAEGRTERVSSVYVIRNERTRHLKIGMSSDVAARLSSLRTASGEPLTLVVTIPGDATVERGFHERFASARLNGEWFTETDDIRAWLVDLGVTESRDG